MAQIRGELDCYVEYQKPYTCLDAVRVEVPRKVYIYINHLLISLVLSFFMLNHSSFDDNSRTIIGDNSWRSLKIYYK